MRLVHGEGYYKASLETRNHLGGRLTKPHCSSKLIAISGALDHALNSYKDSIWILTDSRSSIQYWKNWAKIMDSTGPDILSKLVRLGQRKPVRLQWIPVQELQDSSDGLGML
ncbi:RNase H domain-containing protein [Trichonephila clavipes]|nr:RNase H domain-containing protein [Trichonephila clavipes]